MGSQLRWLERTPDKREVDGSIPFEPTKRKLYLIQFTNSTLKNIQINIDEIKVNQHTKVCTIEPNKVVKVAKLKQ